MAFPTVHVVCAYAGSIAPPASASKAIIGKLLWSEAPATGVATVNTAPGPNGSVGQAVFRIRSTVDVWVAVGPSPNPANGTRLAVPANTDYDVYVEAGDKLAWAAA